LELATSRYPAHPLVNASGLVPIRITRGYPRFKLSYTIGASITCLAPARTIFGIEDPDVFRSAYVDHLESMGIDVIRHEIQTVSAANDGRGLVLAVLRGTGKVHTPPRS
jgi:hypothetical protein